MIGDNGFGFAIVTKGLVSPKVDTRICAYEAHEIVTKNDACPTKSVLFEIKR